MMEIVLQQHDRHRHVQSNCALVNPKCWSPAFPLISSELNFTWEMALAYQSSSNFPFQFEYSHFVSWFRRVELEWSVMAIVGYGQEREHQVNMLLVGIRESQQCRGGSTTFIKSISMEQPIQCIHWRRHAKTEFNGFRHDKLQYCTRGVYRQSWHGRVRCGIPTVIIATYVLRFHWGSMRRTHHELIHCRETTGAIVWKVHLRIGGILVQCEGNFLRVTIPGFGSWIGEKNEDSLFPEKELNSHVGDEGEDGRGHLATFVVDTCATAPTVERRRWIEVNVNE